MDAVNAVFLSKTRIALELAFQYQAFEAGSVFWIHAGTASQIEKAFDDIAKTVQLPGWELDDPDIDRMGQVKEWFESRLSHRWLLIIDNADDIDVLYTERVGKTPGVKSRLVDYFPRSSNGTIVLTTRNMKIGRSFVPQHAPDHVIKIDPWSLPESERFLTLRLVDQATTPKDIGYLAELLEYHPLALVQATAYMCTESVSLSRYLTMYKQSDQTKIQLLSEDFEDETRYANVKNPVAATLQISFDYIDCQFPLSATLLSAMSLLDTKAIPESFLTLGNDFKSITDALGKLQAYSLIKKRTDSLTYRGQEYNLFDLQGLVRLAFQAWLKDRDKLQNAARYVLKTLDAQYPDRDRDEWVTYQVYHPHVLVFLQNLPKVLITGMSVSSGVGRSFVNEIDSLEASLGAKVSWYLRQIGDYQTAEPIARRSLTLLSAIHGPTSQVTLEGVVALAQVLEKQGKYDEAEWHFRQVLNLKERASLNGPELRDLICGLADIYKNQGKYVKAQEYFQRALDITQHSTRERDMSDDVSSDIHYDLGALYDRQGKNDEAQIHFGESYEIRKRRFGSQNALTLRARQGLGLIYFRKGDSESALQHLLAVLDGRRTNTQIGPDHPDTLRTHCCVAVVYKQQKRLAKAEQMLEPIVDSMETRLGKDHPHTLEAKHELGIILKLKSRYTAAREQLQATMTGRSARLGADHPQTLDTMYELGIICERLGMLDQARSLCKQVLLCREERYGLNDNHTLSACQALAIVLESAGCYTEAERLLLRVIEGWDKNSRTKSMDFLRAHQHLITIYMKQGQFVQVQPFFERLIVLKDILKRRLSSNRALDSKHLLILNLKHECGEICLLLGQLEEAVVYCKSALEGQEERLGLTNVDTLRTLRTLGAILEQQGRDMEAEQLYHEALRVRDKLEPDDTVLACVNYQLGGLYIRAGQRKKAEQSFRQALQARVRKLGNQHPDTVQTRQALANVNPS